MFKSVLLSIYQTAICLEAETHKSAGLHSSFFLGEGGLFCGNSAPLFCTFLRSREPFIRECTFQNMKNSVLKALLTCTTAILKDMGALGCIHTRNSSRSRGSILKQSFTLGAEKREIFKNPALYIAYLPSRPEFQSITDQFNCWRYATYGNLLRKRGTDS